MFSLEVCAGVSPVTSVRGILNHKLSSGGALCVEELDYARDDCVGLEEFFSVT